MNGELSRAKGRQAFPLTCTVGLKQGRALLGIKLFPFKIARGHASGRKIAVYLVNTGVQRQGTPRCVVVMVGMVIEGRHKFAMSNVFAQGDGKQ